MGSKQEVRPEGGARWRGWVLERQRDASKNRVTLGKSLTLFGWEHQVFGTRCQSRARFLIPPALHGPFRVPPPRLGVPTDRVIDVGGPFGVLAALLSVLARREVGGLQQLGGLGAHGARGAADCGRVGAGGGRPGRPQRPLAPRRPGDSPEFQPLGGRAHSRLSRLTAGATHKHRDGELPVGKRGSLLKASGRKRPPVMCQLLLTFSMF